MKTILKRAILAIALAAPLGPAAAQNLVVVLDNSDYRTLPDVPDTLDMMGILRRFSQLGFENLRERNADEAAMKQLLNDTLRFRSPGHAFVMVLSGQFFTTGRETFFAPTDLRAGSAGAVATDAVPVSLILQWMSEHPGLGALFLASQGQGAGGDGALLPGIGRFAVPQGVMVAIGTPDAVNAALTGPFLTPGLSMAEAARRSPDLEIRGLASPTTMLAGPGAAPQDERPAGGAQERGFWDAAETLGSRMGYEAYLRAYPEGRFSGLARQRLREIAATDPRRPGQGDGQQPDAGAADRAKRQAARAAEESLDLPPGLRLMLETRLAEQQFDPGAVDGSFDRDTRRALRRYQRSRQLEVTGFVTRETMLRLLAE